MDTRWTFDGHSMDTLGGLSMDSRWTLLMDILNPNSDGHLLMNLDGIGQCPLDTNPTLITIIRFLCGQILSFTKAGKKWRNLKDEKLHLLCNTTLKHVRTWPLHDLPSLLPVCLTCVWSIGWFPTIISVHTDFYSTSNLTCIRLTSHV